ncbi:organic cation transporter protein-like [Anticarsia gemmatalis]|uniref:organic cation transporter protein-like n=1 Tax=Anticarsia gemmatalis TaxID=129554 RepID=UPI003F764501
MDEDHLETAIGRFGKYQAFVYFLIAIARFPTEYQLNNVVFIIPKVEYKCLDNNLTNYCPCENPQYDTSSVVSSVTSEWDLICDKTSLASLAQSILHVGILTGSFLLGYMSDRYGRKTVVLMSLVLEILFVAISAVVPDFWMFLVCRFLIGVMVGGTMLSCYVLFIELCGKSFRPYFIGLQELPFIVSYVTLPIIAYFVRDWRPLQLITSLPWNVVIVYYWLIPESPRWLITVGKREEAIKVLKYIAKINNRPTENIEAIISKVEIANQNQQKTSTYADLFKTPKIRLYTMITAFIWMFCSHTFFGLNQYIGRLQGNIYLNVMLSASFFVPALILVIISTKYCRRKVSAISCFITAGVSLLVFIFVPNELRAVSLTFAIIGFTAAGVSFVQTYLFTSEVFPTVIRNTAIGFASMFARFGGFIAPFVVNIGIEWVSILIFSGIAFCAAALCLFLPETKDTTLPNTIEQRERAKA